MSKEDTSSTKGKSKIINDSDNLRSPGQEKRDREALSDSPLLENTDYHSDSCQKDIIINDKPEQDGLIVLDICSLCLGNSPFGEGLLYFYEDGSYSDRIHELPASFWSSLLDLGSCL
ncbi:hypothetical protein V6N11_013810 [Hibiscus sabdariffa]|uniref:Uncharacterized protein n=1 Tax=Hibiscus sabdariffa TaxID=183260 RepID=A0ABR2PCY6_9ROSI